MQAYRDHVVHEAGYSMEQLQGSYTPDELLEEAKRHFLDTARREEQLPLEYVLRQLERVP